MGLLVSYTHTVCISIHICPESSGLRSLALNDAENYFANGDRTGVFLVVNIVKNQTVMNRTFIAKYQDFLKVVTFTAARIPPRTC